MSCHCLLTTTTLLLAGLFAAPQPAHAAQSYDSCAGFIDTIPTTIHTQGVWCLRKDLATNISSGVAIAINTNNVIVDCNGFKLGGLAAGVGTWADGVSASDHANITVRNCSIRGFAHGIHFQDSGSNVSSGHLIEDNRFDNNTAVGVFVVGDGSIIRNNVIRDTGGSTTWDGWGYGIYVYQGVDVIGNTVDGVMPYSISGNASAYGIHAGSSFRGSISANRMRGLVSMGSSASVGISTNGTASPVNVTDNQATGGGSEASGIGLYCSSTTVAKNNIVRGFPNGFGIVSCIDAGGNFINP